MKTIKNTTIKQLHHLLKMLLIAMALACFNQATVAQSCAPTIAEFTSVNPNDRGEILKLPATHTFQKIIQSGNDFPNGGTFNHINVDFAGYTPIDGSSTNGYLTINDEFLDMGGAAVLDIKYTGKLWEVKNGVNLNFNNVGGTSRNCSGAVTPWGTIISSEEHDVRSSSNNKTAEGYYEFGWQVEIDPKDKKVLHKLYAMGNFAHENAAIQQHNGKTVVYQGADQFPGYLYKFVSKQANDLTDGDLYVYKGPKTNNNGAWVKINNQTVEQRNTVIQSAANAGATVFDKIEDVEISPDGLVYFAVKNEDRVYYLKDTNPTGAGQVNFKGTYVGGRSYSIKLNNGTVNEPWGSGNDNLAFDNEGNLWVLQDGGEDHIWLVKNGHTQSNPMVEVFATTPNGSEPTGITFSPDNRFMFISLQHPGRNTQTLTDAAGEAIRFIVDITVVIARNEHLGNNGAVLGCIDDEACNYNALATIDDCSCTYAEPNFDCEGNCTIAIDCNNNCGGQALPGTTCNDGNPDTINDTYNENCTCIGESLCKEALVIQANPFNLLQNLYESSATIETEKTNSSGVDVLVRKNETVDLKSAHIKLNEGFKVESGACLNAEIAPCE